MYFTSISFTNKCGQICIFIFNICNGYRNPRLTLTQTKRTTVLQIEDGYLPQRRLVLFDINQLIPINKQCEHLSRDKCMLLKKSNSTHLVPSYYVVLCLSQKYTIHVDLRALNVLSSASLVLIFEHVGQSVCVSDVRPQLI